MYKGLTNANKYESCMEIEIIILQHVSFHIDYNVKDLYAQNLIKIYVFSESESQ